MGLMVQWQERIRVGTTRRCREHGTSATPRGNRGGEAASRGRQRRGETSGGQAACPVEWGVALGVRVRMEVFGHEVWLEKGREKT
jgi:hypothetical protein